MRDTLGSSLCVQACVSDANDPMHDNGETADVTGDYGLAHLGQNLVHRLSTNAGQVSVVERLIR